MIIGASSAIWKREMAKMTMKWSVFRRVDVFLVVQIVAFSAFLSVFQC
jgi:hypothetical protein